MAKKKNVFLSSGQGALIGGFNTHYKTKIEFGPKVIVAFAFLIVIFIWILFKTIK